VLPGGAIPGLKEMQMSEAGNPIAAEYLPLFQEVEGRLKQSDWFTNEWSASAGEFPGGVGLQLSKSNWFNQSGNGIHFESWINRAELKRRTVPVVLHVETAFPGKKKAFLQLLLERRGELIQSWAGYTVSTTNSMQPFIYRMPLEKERLVSGLCHEFSRLQVLVPVIDQIIEDAPR
jgi:hypothetical protein